MADKNHAEETKTKSDHDEQDKRAHLENQSNSKPKVCRRLDFGNDEKELIDLIAWSKEDLERHRQRSIEKWNFDFENEVPLEGNWQWEKVPVQVPEAKEIVFNMEKEHHENRTV